jgi:hypothetical protein
MIPYLKDQKHSTQKLLDTMARYKINLEKSLTFLYTNNGQIVKEYMKTIPITIASKEKK